MIVKPFKTLSVAASSGKVGFVLLINGELKDWGLSIKASKSSELTADKAQAWINFYQPDVVITELITKHSRKSQHNQQVIQAIAETAIDSDAQHVEIERTQDYDNKYVEAQALAEKYPVIANWLPKPRKLWEAEPKNMVLFEAISLAESN